MHHRFRSRAGASFRLFARVCRAEVLIANSYARIYEHSLPATVESSDRVRASLLEPAIGVHVLFSVYDVNLSAARPATVSPSCQSGKFSCDSGAKCLPPHKRCNNHYDCIDMTDEMNCKSGDGCVHSRPFDVCLSVSVWR